MLTRCPNCKKEFIIGDELIGECPHCKIKLMFKGKDEIIEKVNIMEIERKVDEITSQEKLSEIDKTIINDLKIEEDMDKIEEEIDKL
ncbi:MAG: hypothetical protein DRN11_04590 [Thermoplasmata archaeon]|nr:MAG: hypothetical protein DRN11_04590 [Thermoplasmata archaeon]